MTNQAPTDAKALTHLDEQGAARMVDVGGKGETARFAMAQGRVSMSAETLAAIVAGNLKKGDVLGTARLAGIMAAKKTADLIPLCHPLALNKVEVTIEADDDEPGLVVMASVSVTGRTGVEMEALTAVSVACLTVYDMAKALQKDMVIGPIALHEKTGGASGDYKRDG